MPYKTLRGEDICPDVVSSPSTDAFEVITLRFHVESSDCGQPPEGEG